MSVWAEVCEQVCVVCEVYVIVHGGLLNQLYHSVTPLLSTSWESVDIEVEC